MLARKKQSSQLAFNAPLRPFAMRDSPSSLSVYNLPDDPIKANFAPVGQARFSENAVTSRSRKSLQTAGLF
jgi:hypothetical protein